MRPKQVTEQMGDAKAGCRDPPAADANYEKPISMVYDCMALPTATTLSLSLTYLSKRVLEHPASWGLLLGSPSNVFTLHLALAVAQAVRDR
jgi:hypothetical protein